MIRSLAKRCGCPQNWFCQSKTRENEDGRACNDDNDDDDYDDNDDDDNGDDGNDDNDDNGDDNDNNDNNDNNYTCNGK